MRQLLSRLQSRPCWSFGLRHKCRCCREVIVQVALTTALSDAASCGIQTEQGAIALQDGPADINPDKNPG